jgi:Fur family iron response transcriptional regulator
MKPPLLDTLREAGIQPSAQRLAVAEVALGSSDHPSADQVWTRARRKLRVLSRATVYNTLNLLVAKGLLRQHVLAEGNVVFDPIVTPHHHFIDEVTGTIHDIPWDALRVHDLDSLREFEVHEYQVVLRGRRREPSGADGASGTVGASGGRGARGVSRPKPGGASAPGARSKRSRRPRGRPT